MQRSHSGRAAVIAATLCSIGIIVVVTTVGCGGGGGGDGGGGGATVTGQVRTHISDPPVCEAPTGDLEAVWVTVTKVRAHLSSTEDPNGSGWVDLVDLTDNPVQINLLDLDSTQCLLTMLGSTTGLPPGTYQQIRIHLLSNNPPGGAAVPSPNACAGTGGYNCVDTVTGGLAALLLSSQANNGLKIPPGQISGGGIVLEAGQAADINIDFDACRSVLQQGNGMWRLKPTLHAGEVSVNNSVVSGRVIDSVDRPAHPGRHRDRRRGATGCRRREPRPRADARELVGSERSSSARFRRGTTTSSSARSRLRETPTAPRCCSPSPSGRTSATSRSCP